MTDKVQVVKDVANKVYKNGLTYAQNIQNGVFIPAKALKNHAELKADLKALDNKMDLILSKISK